MAMREQVEVRCETGALAGASGLVFTRTWLPEAAKAVVVVSHGYGEHSGRYEDLGRFLSGRGFVVCAFDFRGHGRSEGERANVARFEDFIHDLEVVAEHVTAQHPDLKTFFFGHSMGGNVALYYALEHPGRIAGLVTSGAGLEVGNEVPAVAKAVAKLVSRAFPGVPIVALDDSAYSRDERAATSFFEDPYVYRGRVKARIGAELLRIGPYLLSRARELQLPMLVMHGGNDRTASPNGSRALCERAASTDVTLRIYDGAFHAIFDDFGREAVLADLATWLDEVVVRWRDPGA